MIKFWTFIVSEASHCQCPVLMQYLGLLLLLHQPNLMASNWNTLHETLGYPTWNFYLKSGHWPAVLAFFVQAFIQNGVLKFYPISKITFIIVVLNLIHSLAAEGLWNPNIVYNILCIFINTFFLKESVSQKYLESLLLTDAKQKGTVIYFSRLFD